jgi:Fur family transcriptional regulator, peroxide stress response regulator
MADPSMLLERKGLKITPQRYAILKFLQQTTIHPTADEVIEQLNRDLPMTSRATVYNTLNTLRDVGLVHEVTHEAGVLRYDANITPHHHFICNQCGKLEDLDWQLFGNLNHEALSAQCPVVENIEVIVRGVCCTCRNR